MQSLRPSAPIVTALLLCASCNNPPFENPLDPESPTYITPPEPDAVIVNTYDNGAPPNTLGYCPETFTDASGRPTLFVSYTNQPAETLRGRGFSLRIDFDVSGAGDPFGGYVEMLIGNDPCPSPKGPFNLEVLNKSALTFWIRRSAPEVDVEVALKSIDEVQTTPKAMVRDYVTASTAWVKARIPITALVAGQDGRRVDLRNLREINFGFARRRFLDSGAAVRGTVFLDEVAFER